MSEENVEVARQLAEAVQRGVEDDDPEAIFDTGLFADDWQWVLQAPFEGKSVWTGRQEYVEFIRAWTGEFEDYSIQFERVIDAGDDRVVAIYHQRATGKGSGVPVEWHGAWSLSCGMAARLERRTTRATPRPSKPPGCRSRRCRRRTSRFSAAT